MKHITYDPTENKSNYWFLMDGDAWKELWKLKPGEGKTIERLGIIYEIACIDWNNPKENI